MTTTAITNTLFGSAPGSDKASGTNTLGKDDFLKLLLAQAVNSCRLVGTEVELEAGGHWIPLDARLYGHQHAQVQQLNVGQVNCVRHIHPLSPQMMMAKRSVTMDCSERSPARVERIGPKNPDQSKSEGSRQN